MQKKFTDFQAAPAPPSGGTPITKGITMNETKPPIWKLVPVTATPEMAVAIEAAIDSQLVASGIHPKGMYRQDGDAIYAAAMEAAPQPGWPGWSSATAPGPDGMQHCIAVPGMPSAARDEGMQLPSPSEDLFDLIRRWAHLPEGQRSDAAREIIGCVNRSYSRGLQDGKGLANQADLVSVDQAVLLAGLQGLCIAADQEWCRADGCLSDWDKGWLSGQLHVFDMYTDVEKSAVAEVREYIGKLSVGATPAPVQQAAPNDDGVDYIMEAVQCFASEWSLVGGRFDRGQMLEQAEGTKQRIRNMLSAAPVQPVGLSEQEVKRLWDEQCKYHRAILAAKEAP